MSIMVLIVGHFSFSYFVMIQQSTGHVRVLNPVFNAYGFFLVFFKLINFMCVFDNVQVCALYTMCAGPSVNSSHWDHILLGFS